MGAEDLSMAPRWVSAFLWFELRSDVVENHIGGTQDPEFGPPQLPGNNTYTLASRHLPNSHKSIDESSDEVYRKLINVLVITNSQHSWAAGEVMVFNIRPIVRYTSDLDDLRFASNTCSWPPDAI